MVSTSLMVDTIPVLSRRNILCAVNCALTKHPRYDHSNAEKRAADHQPDGDSIAGLISRLNCILIWTIKIP